MRPFSLFSLSYLSTAVWAGGYQGCLERVWTFQAYEIDRLNPPEDQTLGFKCPEANFVKATNENFPPHSVAKSQGEFNAFITRVSEIVNKGYREKRTADNAHLWEGFDTTTDKIMVARTGDHGPYLIRNAKKSDKLKGVEIKTQNLGPNPVADPPADWETLDWTATEDEARRNGITDIEERLKAFREGF